MNLFSGDIPVFCKAFFLLGAKALAVAFILGLWAPQTRAEPDVVGKAALLMELHTGKIVWTKNENERLAPVRYLVSRNRPTKPRYHIILDQLKPPIAEGEQLGEVVFGEGKRGLRSVALVAGVDVPEPGSLHIIFWIGLVAALGIFIHRRRKRRRPHRYRFSRRIRF